MRHSMPPKCMWRSRKKAEEAGSASRSRPLPYAGVDSLGVTVQTAGEVRVALLVVRHREVHVAAIVAVLEERARREHVVLRAAILPDESAKITEPLAAAERP